MWRRRPACGLRKRSKVQGGHFRPKTKKNPSGERSGKNASGIMAPMYVDLPTWEAANLPSVALLSVVILFVLAITLLALCTSCQRQSFTLEKSNTPTYSAETNSSTLVRVVKPGTETETPTPERNLSVLPEDLQLGPNQQFKAWRSHTLEKNTHTAVNGGMVTM